MVICGHSVVIRLLFVVAVVGGYSVVIGGHWWLFGGHSVVIRLLFVVAVVGGDSVVLGWL